MQAILLLARYFVTPPFALENLVYNEGADTVILKGERVTKWRHKNFDALDPRRTERSSVFAMDGDSRRPPPDPQTGSLAG